MEANMKKQLIMTIISVISFLTSMNSFAEGIDPMARRLISSPTALTDSATFSGAAHIHTFFGFAFTFGGSINYVAPVAKKLSVGVVSNFGVMMTPMISEKPFFYGGGPAITYGDNDFLISASTLFYGAHCDGEGTWLALPSIGASKRITNWARLQLEVVIPILQEEDFNAIQGGGIMYGIRLGKRVFADVNFIAPFGGGDVVEVYHYFPMGIPILSVGVTF
jgi:hypothetical protein